MQAQQVVLARNIAKPHSSCEFEFLMVEYQRCDYYEEIVLYYPRNSSMYSICAIEESCSVCRRLGST